MVNSWKIIENKQQHFRDLSAALNLMISLCPGCHAKVERTKMVLSEMNPLLLVLWREQHPDGPEQTMLASTRERRPLKRFRWDSTIFKGVMWK
jgi:hypothetical protein